jgi:hypothetical protein
MLLGAPEPVPPELLKARLEAAEEAYRLSLASFMQLRGGQLGSNPESIALWSQRILEAKRPLCKDKQEEIAAVREHLDRLKDLEAKTQKYEEAGLGKRQDLLAVRYHRSEAEIMLFQLKGK